MRFKISQAGTNSLAKMFISTLPGSVLEPSHSFGFLSPQPGTCVHLGIFLQFPGVGTCLLAWWLDEWLNWNNELVTPVRPRSQRKSFPLRSDHVGWGNQPSQLLVFGNSLGPLIHSFQPALVPGRQWSTILHALEMPHLGTVAEKFCLKDHYAKDQASCQSLGLSLVLKRAKRTT